jgi:class 3 adenylate cyclase/tetratricopeptide (TPR) repeat protein
VETALIHLREKLTALEAGAPSEQRKMVTVLFADICGFTALSETIDAEDVTALMNAIWQQLDRAILDHGGSIDKHMGDGVMAVWGVETTREDDAERAIRAGLEMQRRLGSFRQQRRLDLGMRIGINTGPVLLGQVGITGEYTAMGDTVNLTSRLEKAAPVDGILVSHNTYRHVHGLFDIQELTPLSVRGKAKAIQVYIVEQAKPRTFRPATRGIEGIQAAMVGREPQLHQLLDALQMTSEKGVCRILTVVGEAGLGKSRLLYEFEKAMGFLPEPVKCFRGRADLDMRSRPYGLIRDIFVLRFQIQDSDPATTAREKLRRGFSTALGEKTLRRTPFIGQLIGFDFSDSPYLQGALDDTRQIRDRAQIYLVDYFKAMVNQHPAVILLEDLHWADDSSLDLLEHLAQAAKDQKLLILCSARPILYERRPHWGRDQDYHVRLDLLPLSKQASRRLVAEILYKVDDLPVALRELVVSGAEGNPYYVEELIKMLIENHVIIRGERHWQVEPVRLVQVHVPPTLTGILQARLDRLPKEERLVLQQAAVVGRSFWEDAVEQINEATSQDEDREPVPQKLAFLQEKDMVSLQTTSAFAETKEYAFKHAILQEVTYESVLKRLRRTYHAIVANWLIDRSSGRTSENSGLIAEHLERAGEVCQAATYLHHAGKQAATQYAHTEALHYFDRALHLLSKDDHATRYAVLIDREKVYDLQGNRESQYQDLLALEALVHTVDYRAPTQDSYRIRQAEVALRLAHYGEVTSDYSSAVESAQRAVDLAQGVQDESLTSETAPLLATGFLQWGRALLRQAEYDTAQSRIGEGLAWAQIAGLRRVEADCLRSLGNITWHQGLYGETRQHYEEALQIYREIGDLPGESTTLNNLGSGAATQGDFRRAREYFEQSLIIHRETGDRRGEGRVLNNLGMVSAEQCDYPGARRYFEQALHIRQEVGERRGEGMVLNNLGNIASYQGDYDGARTYYEKALRILCEIGDRQGEGRCLNNLGSISRQFGRYAEAKALLEQAVIIFRDIGDRRGESQGLCELALLSHRLDNNVLAHEYSLQGLRIARETADRHREGYALTNLGRALAGLGRIEEAAASFRDALAVRRLLGENSLAMESLACLASILLVQCGSAAAPEALTCVEEILDYLAAQSLHGTDEPLQVYQTCYQVLRSCQDPRAKDILTAAHQILIEQASQITDKDLRQDFTDRVAVHRQIRDLWSEIGGPP